MSSWGECRVEVVARKREILSLATQGYPAAAIHRQLGLSGSLRSLQRWLRHMRSGQPVVAVTIPQRTARPSPPEQDGATESQEGTQTKGYQRRPFSPEELF